MVRTLVSPANPKQIIPKAQKAVDGCGLLSELCSLLMTLGVPAEILSEIICTVGESIRGCRTSQEKFGQVMASLHPPRTKAVAKYKAEIREQDGQIQHLRQRLAALEVDHIAAKVFN